MIFKLLYNLALLGKTNFKNFESRAYCLCISQLRYTRHFPPKEPQNIKKTQNTNDQKCLLLQLLAYYVTQENASMIFKATSKLQSNVAYLTFSRVIQCIICRVRETVCALYIFLCDKKKPAKTLEVVSGFLYNSLKMTFYIIIFDRVY